MKVCDVQEPKGARDNAHSQIHRQSVNVYGRPRVSKHFLTFVEGKERSSSYVYPAS